MLPCVARALQRVESSKKRFSSTLLWRWGGDDAGLFGGKLLGIKEWCSLLAAHGDHLHVVSLSLLRKQSCCFSEGRRHRHSTAFLRRSSAGWTSPRGVCLVEGFVFEFWKFGISFLVSSLARMEKTWTRAGESRSPGVSLKFVPKMWMHFGKCWVEGDK